MQYLNTTIMLSSALVPAVFVSIAGMVLARNMFLEKLGYGKRFITEKALKSPIDEIINEHFQSFISKDVYLTAKGRTIKTTIIREGISFYTLFTNDQPVMSISKKAFGWVVLKDYSPDPKYRSLTLPFIMHVEQVLYN